MKYGISDVQLKEIIDFIQGYPEVEEAVLFGSRARDTYKEASDVDIVTEEVQISGGYRGEKHTVDQIDYSGIADGFYLGLNITY